MIFNFKKPENINTNILEYVSDLKNIANSGNYNQPEASINLPLDVNNLEKVKDLGRQKVGQNLKYIIDIGIGGSNLGTKAVYDAKYSCYDMLALIVIKDDFLRYSGP
jgi:glucose-6-phosphate isomerase